MVAQTVEKQLFLPPAPPPILPMGAAAHSDFPSTFSSLFSLIYYSLVKEAAGSLGFTCLWGKGRAALRPDCSSLLPALWLALQTTGEGFYPNFAAFSLCSLSRHLSFETGSMTSTFCPMSCKRLKNFVARCFFFYFCPHQLCCCAWTNDFCRVESAAKASSLLSFLSKTIIKNYQPQICFDTRLKLCSDTTEKYCK